MSKKYIPNLMLFSTGLTGVITGALLTGSLNLAVANTYDSLTSKVAQTPAVVERAESGVSKTDIADKLSMDFINVSKNVTPAVVTITSSRMVKQPAMNQELFNDPRFRRFFEQQGGNFQQPQEQKQQGLGSGVIINKDGTILTNNHVVEGADDISITLQDKRKFKAKVIGTDPKTDLAVIKIEKGQNLPVAKLGDSNKLAVGEWVLAIGNPLGLSSTVTSGIISAKGRDHVGIADFEDFIQTDAAINPGNSGGALVNLQGEVIGINTAIASKTGGYMGIGFAIPSSMAQKIMDQLISKGKVTRGFLGIQIQDISGPLAKSLNLKDDAKGIIVGRIEPGSPADKAGLKIYDVITGLNNQVVEDVTTFRNSIASQEPGKSVNLELLRDGRKINVSVNLAELDKKVAARAEETSKTDYSDKLGFQVEPLTSDIVDQLNLKSNVSGVIVSGVKNNSSASEAGLERGDIIQEANRYKIADKDDLTRSTASLKPGDSVLLKVLRGDSSMLLAFTLG
jgi:serine protease Do